MPTGTPSAIAIAPAAVRAFPTASATFVPWGPMTRLYRSTSSGVCDHTERPSPKLLVGVPLPSNPADPVAPCDASSPVRSPTPVPSDAAGSLIPNTNNRSMRRAGCMPDAESSGVRRSMMTAIPAETAALRSVTQSESSSKSAPELGSNASDPSARGLGVTARLGRTGPDDSAKIRRPSRQPVITHLCGSSRAKVGGRAPIRLVGSVPPRHAFATCTALAVPTVPTKTCQPAHFNRSDSAASGASSAASAACQKRRPASTSASVQASSWPSIPMSSGYTRTANVGTSTSSPEEATARLDPKRVSIRTGNNTTGSSARRFANGAGSGGLIRHLPSGDSRQPSAAVGREVGRARRRRFRKPRPAPMSKAPRAEER